MCELENDTFDIEEDTQKNKYLTFSIGKETYGIEIKYVTEIIGIQPITQVPQLPKYVMGIINLRGKIIPVMDARIRFGKEKKEYNNRTCNIVIDIADNCLGLIVDGVTEVITIPDENIVLPPTLKNESKNKFIKNIGKVNDSIKLILDCKKLLNEDEINI